MRLKKHAITLRFFPLFAFFAVVGAGFFFRRTYAKSNFAVNQQEEKPEGKREKSRKKVYCAVKMCTCMKLLYLIRLHVICLTVYARILTFHLSMQSGSVKLEASRSTVFAWTYFLYTNSPYLWECRSFKHAVHIRFGNAKLSVFQLLHVKSYFYLFKLIGMRKCLVRYNREMSKRTMATKTHT